jgi:hypothetical protein
VAKFWLYQVPEVGVSEGNRGANVPKPQVFDSLNEAEAAAIRPGFTARIEGPDGSYVYVAGQWSSRFSQVDFLEEVVGSEMTRERVEQRVSDWASRIDALYKQIESWLPQGWTAERNGTVRMHEELMQKFGVPPRKLPILNLISHNERVGHIEPRALWMIGANGRLDFFRGSDHYLITDAAKQFAQPLWHIATFSDRSNVKPLSCETLGKILIAAH